MKRVTPEKIDKLGENEIFVFGSSLGGLHQGGASKLAMKKFGAVQGLGNGLQGNSYAIPTVGVDLDMLRLYVEQFIRIAKLIPGLKFYVTKIGCGKAGFTIEEIAPLFSGAKDVDNIYLPQEFWDIISPEVSEDFLKALNIWEYGLGNMGKAFNGDDPIPAKTVTATKDSWTTLPMPEEHKTLAMDFKLTKVQMDEIKKGHIPEAMEDHWFMYFENNHIHYYRSWTGIEIYDAYVEETADFYRISSLTVNRFSEQYGETDDKKDIALFLSLLAQECGFDPSPYWDIAFS